MLKKAYENTRQHIKMCHGFVAIFIVSLFNWD